MTDIKKVAIAIQDLLIDAEWSVDIDHKWPAVCQSPAPLAGQVHVVCVAEVDNEIVLTDANTIIFTHKTRNNVTGNVTTVIDETHSATLTPEEIVALFEEQFDIIDA
jgi:hypothetical protein